MEPEARYSYQNFNLIGCTGKKMLAQLIHLFFLKV